MKFNNLLTKILILGLIVLFILSGIIIFVMSQRQIHPIIYSRMLESQEVVYKKSFASFAGKLNNFDAAYFQKFCEDNTRTINDNNLREKYGTQNYSQYYDTFRLYKYISTRFDTENGILNCFAYQTIKPQQNTRPVTQVFIDPFLYKKGSDLTNACGYYLNRINQSVKDFDFKQIENTSLTVCEG